jgi:hypothetical protein
MYFSAMTLYDVIEKAKWGRLIGRAPKMSQEIGRIYFPVTLCSYPLI